MPALCLRPTLSRRTPAARNITTCALTPTGLTVSDVKAKVGEKVCVLGPLLPLTTIKKPPPSFLR